MADKKLPYDPKLQEARKKIRKILERYDITGFITIQSDSHVEFLNHVEASWSIATPHFEDGKFVGYRFRSKCEDFPSKEVQDHKTKVTIAMMMSGKDMARFQYEQFDAIEKQLRKHVKFFHPVLNPKQTYIDPNMG